MDFLKWGYNFASSKLDNMELDLTIGEAIMRLREWIGVSKENLALETGLYQQDISDIETGKRDASLSMLSRITDYFSLGVADLIDLADSTWKFNENTDEVTKWLRNNGFEDTLILESPNYLAAISGLTDEGRLVYSYRKMVWYLMMHDGMDYDIAVEFIDYNTLGALSYMGPNAPIVIQDVLSF